MKIKITKVKTMKNKNSILPFNIREGASHFYFFYELTGSLLVYQDLMKGLSPHFSIYGPQHPYTQVARNFKRKKRRFCKDSYQATTTR